MNVVFGGAITRTVLFSDTVEVAVSFPSAVNVGVNLLASQGNMPGGGTQGQVIVIDNGGNRVWTGILDDPNLTIDGGLIS